MLLYGNDVELNEMIKVVISKVRKIEEIVIKDDMTEVIWIQRNTIDTITRLLKNKM